MEMFEYVGGLRTGMCEYDNKFAYTSLAAAQDLAGLGTRVSGLEAQPTDPYQARRSGRIEKGAGHPLPHATTG